jgi:hypothetical protein
VTALTAYADGFSGRPDGLTRAQPGPGVNIPRPIDVGVQLPVHGTDHGVLSGAGASSPALVAADAGAAGHPLRAVTGHEHDLIKPAVRLEPWMPGLLPSPAAVMERLDDHVQPTQGLLLRGERTSALPVPVVAPDFLQLSRSNHVGDARLPHSPRLSSFLQRGVVRVAVISQQPPGTALLRERRAGTELVGSSHPHRSWCPNVGHGPGYWRRRAAVCRPYGPVPTSGPRHAGGRECGSPCHRTAAAPSARS